MVWGWIQDSDSREIGGSGHVGEGGGGGAGGGVWIDCLITTATMTPPILCIFPLCLCMCSLFFFFTLAVDTGREMDHSRRGRDYNLDIEDRPPVGADVPFVVAVAVAMTGPPVDDRALRTDGGSPVGPVADQKGFDHPRSVESGLCHVVDDGDGDGAQGKVQGKGSGGSCPSAWPRVPGKVWPTLPSGPCFG